MSWQEKLDGLFPSGLKVIRIEDVIEGVGTENDDSVSFLTPQLHVLEEKDGAAVVQLFIHEFQKDLIFTITELSEVSPGVYLAKTPEGKQDYLLSANLPKAVLAQLKEARQA